MADRDSEGAGAEAHQTPRLAERLGAALLSPGRALSFAERAPGRTSSDAGLLLALFFAGGHVDVLVSGGWMALEGQAVAGLQSLLSQASRALAAPLVFLFAGGALLWLFAGRRRSLGTDFDRASVALVPLLTVHAGAALWAQALGRLPAAGHDAANALGYGWAALVLAIAVGSRWRGGRGREGGRGAGGEAGAAKEGPA